ncbi:unnamed protein product [Bursaphelenchus xylophilus]|uniref:(pine wood nematode) hypothetical protein n=1 Tax=Bursaphelenchus xylophilus TaxID=6326 RepID=A0A1I7RUB2_BURXY|nr:unnamed protein product [Bursaphelenchus xylophilus]CAG9114002.1 unnamed protein product [Bursaphelenchus xylophilus]
MFRQLILAVLLLLTVGEVYGDGTYSCGPRGKGSVRVHGGTHHKSHGHKKTTGKYDWATVGNRYGTGKKD